jgi:methyl-accepting chemotaxis protein
LSIKFKFIFIALGIVIVIAFSVVSQRWSATTLNSLNQTQLLNQTLVSDMLMLRRNEKDFLIRNDLKYRDEFVKNYEMLQVNITRLGELLEGNHVFIENYQSLKNTIDNYASSFKSLVRISIQIGLDKNLGFRGQLRDSVHRAETVFKQADNDRLLNNMLTLRRNEKDFIIRKEKQYIEKFKDNYAIFIENIQYSDFDEQYKQQLLNDVKDYNNNFLQLTKLNIKQGLDYKSGIRGAMRMSVHRSEILLKNVSMLG